MRIRSHFMRRRAEYESGFLWLPVMLGIVLLATGFGAGYAVITKWQAERRQDAQPTPLVLQAIPSKLPVNPFPSDLLTPVASPQSTSIPSGTSPQTPASTRPLALGVVFWHERSAIPDQRLWELPRSFSDASENSRPAYYEVGTFADSAYGNGSLIMLEAPCLGMCFRNDFFLFASFKERFMFIAKYSDGVYPENGLRTERFTIDDALAIPDLDFPKDFAQPGTRITAELDPYRRDWFDARGLEKIFVHATYGDAYTDTPPHSTTSGSFFMKRNGIYFRGPDGMERVYELKPNILINGVAQLTWNDGSRNTAKYEFTDVGGCGAQNYASVIDPDVLNPAQDLAMQGTTQMGEAIYELLDENHPILENIYQNQYRMYETGKQKVPYAEFVASHPVFFWSDPLGRLLKFQRADFMPLAECAKPVIYLYPEKQTRAHVRIAPQGGLSHAEPPYDAETGWVVNAHPSGTLMDTATGGTFPYLFWEGRGGLYEQPRKGFVVERVRVNAFLNDALAQLGLTEREIGDFISYWEPHMRSAPYYFITFLGAREMDRLAPLAVEPKPDTVIRILMDFSPLTAPVPVKPIELWAPKRVGFTVVEWGGVRR